MKFIVKGERMGGGGGGVVRDEGNPVPHLTNVTWVRVKVSTSLLLGLSVPPSLREFFFSRFSFSSFYLQRTFQILIRCGRSFQLAEITDFKMVLN